MKTVNSNLRISEQCIQCGSCVGMAPDMLEETSGGIAVKNGIFVDVNDKKIQKLISVCPVGAISVDTSVKKESGKDALRRIIAELETLPGISLPDKKAFHFNATDYPIRAPYVPSSQYCYSSERAANNAAEQAFNQAAYSKIDAFILQILAAYRAQKLTPYYSDKYEDGSVYALSNERVQKLLAEAEQTVLKNSATKLSTDFSQFNISPAQDKIVKDLWRDAQKGNLLTTGLVESIHSEFSSGSYSSLSSYSMYWDTDYMERYAGTGLFGKTKTKDEYCYRNVNEACEELMKDVHSACNMCDTEIESGEMQFVTYFVDAYNELMRTALTPKIQALKEAAATMK